MEPKRVHWHMTHKFNQNWPNFQPTQIEWDDIDLEIMLQDIICPPEETDLNIAKDMLTSIGIDCTI